MPVDKFGRSSNSTIGGGVWQFSTGGLVHKVCDTMMGILSSGGFRITNVGTPTENADAATKGYADTIDLDNLQLAGGTMSGGINMSEHRITGLPVINTPDSVSDAVSWAQVVKYADEQAAGAENHADEIAAELGTLTRRYADQKDLEMGTAVRRYADEKDTALNVAVRAHTIQKTASAGQYTNEKVVEVKRYADGRDVISRGLHVLKPGDTMTGNLDMGGQRVTGLPTDAPTTQSDAASIAQVAKVVTDTMKNLNQVPTMLSHVTNKQYVDAAVRENPDEQILSLTEVSNAQDVIVKDYADRRDIALNTALRLYTDKKLQPPDSMQMKNPTPPNNMQTKRIL